jgi:hypothetical protein
MGTPNDSSAFRAVPSKAPRKPRIRIQAVVGIRITKLLILKEKLNPKSGKIHIVTTQKSHVQVFGRAGVPKSREFEPGQLWRLELRSY